MGAYLELRSCPLFRLFRIAALSIMGPGGLEPPCRPSAPGRQPATAWRGKRTEAGAVPRDSQRLPFRHGPKKGRAFGLCKARIAQHVQPGKIAGAIAPVASRSTAKRCFHFPRHSRQVLFTRPTPPPFRWSLPRRSSPAAGARARRPSVACASIRKPWRPHGRARSPRPDACSPAHVRPRSSHFLHAKDLVA